MVNKAEVKREIYLDIIRKSSGKNIAFLGEQFVGKSVLLKSVKNCAYINFEKIGLSPEDFAVSYIAALDKALGSCKGCDEIKAKVENELQKIKPDHRLLVSLAFTYAETYAREKKIRVKVLIDEFWRLLDLNNFTQISDVLTLFKSLDMGNIDYVVTGSAVVLSKAICVKLGFKVVEFSGLSRSETKEYAAKLGVTEDVFEYTQGIPLYIRAIAGLKNLGVKNAFLAATLFKQGVIYNACQHKLNSALDRARGKTLLFSILNVLCSVEGLRLNEVSRRIYRAAAVTKNLLVRLIDVDLVVKDGNEFKFNDSILRFWFKHYVSGVEFDFVPAKDELDKLEVDL